MSETREELIAKLRAVHHRSIDQHRAEIAKVKTEISRLQLVVHDFEEKIYVELESLEKIDKEYGKPSEHSKGT